MRHILPPSDLVALVILITFTSLAAGALAGLLVSIAVC
jgi:hypothetical protein